MARFGVWTDNDATFVGRGFTLRWQAARERRRLVRDALLDSGRFDAAETAADLSVRRVTA